MLILQCSHDLDHCCFDYAVVRESLCFGGDNGDEWRSDVKGGGCNEVVQLINE